MGKIKSQHNIYPQINQNEAFWSFREIHHFFFHYYVVVRPIKLMCWFSGTIASGQMLPH